MKALAVPSTRPPTVENLKVLTHTGSELAKHLPRLEGYVAAGGQVPLSRHLGWLPVLERGLRHTTYCLETRQEEQTRGVLPLACVSSLLFGRFLVSLPYLNYGGPLAEDEAAASVLIDTAVALADSLNVRYLELRNEWGYEHPALGQRMTSKMHMRLPLPASAEELWDQIPAKVRNQVRKAQKNDLQVSWGGEDLLPDFYAVFSQNMRDLGTPVFGSALFQAILAQFAGRAEFCVVRSAGGPLAAGLLLHGWGISEVPSASSLRQFNHTNANMLLYWHMLERAVERKQEVFDFGRSSEDSSTYRFKKQWGALPHPAEWQYYVRKGTIQDMRPQNPKYQTLIRIWQHLPLRITRLLGPRIVRAIP